MTIELEMLAEGYTPDGIDLIRDKTNRNMQKLMDSVSTLPAVVAALGLQVTSLESNVAALIAGSSTSAANIGLQYLKVSARILLDPYDNAGLFQERTGAAATTPAVVDGPVGSAKNFGNIGGWAVSDSDGERPILRAGGGKRWLEFPGSAMLRLVGAGINLATFEMYAGIQIRGWVAGQSGIITFAGAAGNDYNQLTAMAALYINSSDYAVATRAGVTASLQLGFSGIQPQPHVYELLKANNSSAILNVDRMQMDQKLTAMETFTTQGGDLVIGKRQQNGLNQPGNFNLFALAILNEVVADRTQIRAFMESRTTGVQPALPVIADAAELESKRTTLISEVFATKGGVLPVTTATSVVESPNKLAAFVTLTNLDRSEKYTVPDYDAEPRKWVPLNPRNDIVVLAVQGHDGAPHGNNVGAVVVKELLDRGIRVVTFALPDGVANNWTSGGPSQHEATKRPLCDWVGPVKIIINTLKAELPGVKIWMTGISGGGFTTGLAGACLSEIEFVNPVAGTVPEYLAKPTRDWEQRLPGVSVGFMTQYLLAAKNGKMMHILGDGDTVIITKADYDKFPDFTAGLAAKATALGANYEFRWLVGKTQHNYDLPSFTSYFLNQLPPRP